jgi:transposase
LIALYDEQNEIIEMKIEHVMKSLDSKIMSVPGISGILSSIILGEVANVDRFTSVKKLIAFAGLDPVISQSGRYENKTGPISKKRFSVASSSSIPGSKCCKDER